ncbi:MAG: glycosyltransferase family 39 protein [Planctomycetota bacterium]
MPTSIRTDLTAPAKAAGCVRIGAREGAAAQEEGTASRTGVWWCLLLVAAGLAEAIYAWRMPLPELAALIPDDSFFYLQVAHRFVEEGRFAFGPGEETYGFQPLWQLVVIGLAYLTPDRAALLYVTLVACVALRALAGVLLFRLGRSLWGTAAGAWASAVWVFNPAVAVWSWGLKENTLYAVLLVLAASALLAFLRRGRGGAWLGLWLGLCIVTRVNAALPAVVFLAVALVAPGMRARRQRGRPLLGAIGVMVAVAAPWFVFAWARFGTMLPTSGVWKLAIGRSLVENVWHVAWGSTAHVLRGGREALGYLATTVTTCVGPAEFVLAGAAAAWLATWPFLRRRQPATPSQPGTWSVALGLACGAGLSAWLTAMTLAPYLAYAKWYTVSEFVVVALGAGLILARAVSLLPLAAGRLGLAVALTIALLVWPADRWRQPGHGPWLGATLPHALLSRAPAVTQTLEFGLWAARHVPETETLGMFDPGAITYFSGCRVVSLDPLMNSLEFQRQGLLDPGMHYARTCLRLGIDHVVGSGYREGESWVFRGLLPGTYEVLWVPFPDFPLPWGGDRPVHLMVVRLLGADGPELVQPDALPHGAYRPNDPPTVRVAEAAARPASVSGDALRLHTASPRGVWSLWNEGHELTAAPVGGDGWAFFDLRHVGALHPELRFDGERTLPALLEAYAVDFTFPVRR